MTDRLPFDQPDPGPTPRPGPDPDLGPGPDPTPGIRPRIPRRVYTVTELTSSIRQLLESSYAEVWVEGEISNCRTWKTGHLYFTLKDGGAQIRAVMFRSALRYLRFGAEDGLQVVARGRLGVYEPKGEYQLVAEHLEPRGLGALQLAFDQLRRKLAEEGLFDAARKRPLPALPRKIGVVTSLDGAALRDIIQVLGRRYPNAHLVISATRVQGEGAAPDIVRALGRLQRVERIDVVIVGRGGGSMEDLWAFNDERVARAVVASPVPVIAAVGHESDYTITDFVADLRAPTPSAAAEMVVTRKEDMVDRINRAAARLATGVRRDIERRRVRVQAVASRPGLAGWPARLVLRGRHTGELTHRLAGAARAAVNGRERRAHALGLRLQALDLRRRLAEIRARLTAARTGLVRGVGDVCTTRTTGLARLAGRLDALNPLGVLARGYAVCWNDTRTSILRDSAGVAVGDTVRVTLHRGELECDVRKTE